MKANSSRPLPLAGGEPRRLTDFPLDVDAYKLSPDGSQCAEGERHGSVSEAAQLGADLGRELRARAPAGIYDPA